jgi:RNA-directed DNA polymerase
MNLKFKLIAQKAKQDKRMRFTSLMHYFSKENLERCYELLKKNKACGIDGVTVEEYGNNLDANITDLTHRLKTKSFKPLPVRRVYIPKPGKDALRPLGIPCVEDKLVQMVLKEILEVIFEQDFYDCSYGFRPERSCHTAIKQLNRAVMYNLTHYIDEVDIEKFFDSVQHDMLIQCLEQRVADPNILWLVRKFLKAGIMEAGKLQASEIGTPQGGVVSPLLANIYLHYALDRWFELCFKAKAKGYVELIRYCDDFVVACESEHDAKAFMVSLEKRLALFGLKISKEKTRCIKFGRRVWQQAQRIGRKVETFNFLGFTHYCTKSRKGWFIMGHKTSGINLSRKLKAVNTWMRKSRNAFPLNELWATMKAKLIGHYNYFGINGNIRCLQQYYRRCVSIVYKWINRRSQKKSMNREEFQAYLLWNPLPQPRICHPILYGGTK